MESKSGRACSKDGTFPRTAEQRALQLTGRRGSRKDGDGVALVLGGLTAMDEMV